MNSMASKRVETDGSRNYYLIGAALGACLYFFNIVKSLFS